MSSSRASDKPGHVYGAVALAAWLLLAGGPGAASHHAEPVRPRPEWRIEPNTASAAELQLLPRIGPALAEAIVSYRREVAAPAFRTPDDLARVRGIGPRTVERIAPLLRFDPPGRAADGRQER